MSGLEPNKVKEKIDTLKFRWQNSTKQYIDTYPAAALGLDTQQHERARAASVKTLQDINLLQAELTGVIKTTADYISEIENGPIAKAKTQYSSQKDDLLSKIGGDKAGKRMKIDKYNENSKAYILTSFYSIGILSITYFIYKQLKQ